MQKRIADAWFDCFLQECRAGNLTDEMYNYLMGLPTRHCGSWLPKTMESQETANDPFLLQCYDDNCQQLANVWAKEAKAGSNWESMYAKMPECPACQAERQRRHRLVIENDQRVLQEPFLKAPYVHQNNFPKYHAMLLRAVEWAKRGGDLPMQVLWMRAEDTPLNPRDIARTPEEVDKRLTRFLQLHDQMTSGIPGLMPLYHGLRVRFTEKINKSKQLTILKHTAGTIVGWELHAADKVPNTSPERLLRYMPKVIFILVDGAEWKLSGLPQGVYPLPVVERNWTLNKGTGAKLKRKGFTLVPDFASTAFMIQGATLDAMIADCGDVNEDPELSRMVCAYVILSRVRSAHKLLLTRAFSSSLFRQGAPPGPQCLRKFLFAKFNADTGQLKHETDSGYGPAEAEQEYLHLTDEWSKLKSHKRKRGKEWPCGLCGMSFPAEGFGADGSDQKAVYQHCISPGSWRKCAACQPLQCEPETSLNLETRQCCICHETRDASHFDGNSAQCASCTLQMKFQVVVCGICQKSCRYDECIERSSKDEPLLCVKCAPKHTPLLCTICHEMKHPGAFTDHQRQNATDECSLRRCKSCSEKCGKCGKYMADARSFATSSNLCWPCYQDSKMLTCNRCNIPKQRREYDSKVLSNAIESGRLLVCLECYKLGYSAHTPHGITSFDCAGGHKCGHLAFDKMKFHNVLYKKTSKTWLLCKVCDAKPTYKCNAENCQMDRSRKMGPWEFDAEQVQNHRKKKGKCQMICKHCVGNGFSTIRGGTVAYQCDSCHRRLGHKSFGKQSLKNAKKRGGQLLCLTCQQNPRRI